MARVLAKWYLHYRRLISIGYCESKQCNLHACACKSALGPKKICMCQGTRWRATQPIVCSAPTIGLEEEGWIWNSNLGCVFFYHPPPKPPGGGLAGMHCPASWGPEGARGTHVKDALAWVAW